MPFFLSPPPSRYFQQRESPVPATKGTALRFLGFPLSHAPAQSFSFSRLTDFLTKTHPTAVMNAPYYLMDDLNQISLQFPAGLVTFVLFVFFASTTQEKPVISDRQPPRPVKD